MTTPTIPFYPVTHDDGTNIVEALNNLVSAKRMPYVVADGFSTSVSYNVEDYVIYENNLYRFTAPHAAGPWDSSQAIRVTIGDQFKTLGIEKINNNAVAPVFRTDANYGIGDVVSHEGNLYRFMFQHTAGEWDRTQVIQTNAISEGGGGSGGSSSGGVGDTITFDGHNMIVNSSERVIDSLESSIAIVATGDTHVSISTGQYVYVKGHEDLNEGLYIASSDIAENGTLSSSNLNDVSSGGLNSLKNNIIDIAHGGTGATTIAAARNTLGLGNTSGALPIANGGTNATTVEGMISNFFKVTTTNVSATIAANAASAFSGPTITQSGYKPLFFSIYPSDYCDHVMWQCGATSISGNNVNVGQFFLCSTYSSQVTATFKVMVLWYKA